jgi:hypothetical protein
LLEFFFGFRETRSGVVGDWRKREREEVIYHFRQAAHHPEMWW